jgi:hypothetical protein
MVPPSFLNMWSKLCESKVWEIFRRISRRGKAQPTHHVKYRDIHSGTGGVGGYLHMLGITYVI